MNAPAQKRAAAFPLRTRLAMVAMGYIPLLNVLAIAGLVTFAVKVEARWVMVLPFIWLLYVPPLVVRLTLWISPLPRGDLALDSRAFLVWWFTSQWQVIFNRLPLIEELLRLLPGGYSGWMRLWGADVGRFVYWTPGLRVLDRSLIRIGDRASFGAGVRLNSHVIMPDETGRMVLRVGVILIGEGAMVGAYSLVLAGCEIAPGEATPALREMRPFTRWHNGKRAKENDA